MVYIPKLGGVDLVRCATWNGGFDDYLLRDQGLIHLKEEDAKAYAKALLSFFYTSL